MDIDPLPATSPLLNMIMATMNVTFDAGSIFALICAGIALLLSGFISGSEIAYFSLTPQQLDELDETPKGETIRGFMNTPERLVTTRFTMPELFSSIEDSG